MEVSLFALSAFLQSRLEVLVTTVEFFPGKRIHQGPSPYPSSLVTVEPYCPGGLRRLVLNVHSPLIQRMAKALSHHEQAVEAIGAAMITTGSWPVPALDFGTSCALTRQVHWKTKRGLIATPHATCAWPVPHDVILLFGQDQKPVHRPLAIWPRRICALNYTNDRGDPGSTKTPEPVYVAQVWKLRDQALELEWKRLVPQRGSSWRSLLSSSSSSSSQVQHSVAPAQDSLNPHSALLTHAPSLPIFVLAQIFQHDHRVPRHAALAEAAEFLVRHDRLFALSLFFGVPLMDRTGTLAASLRIAPLVDPVPTTSQVNEFCQRYSVAPTFSSPTEAQQACHETLSRVMLDRARGLWEMTERSLKPAGGIYVAWSGGIDSTAVLCALLQTATDQQRQARLYVILDEESVAENPTFYQQFVKGRLHEVSRNDRALSWHEYRISRENPNNLLVTGELGDQLFGSDRCKAAFPDAYGELKDLPEHVTAGRQLQLPKPGDSSLFVEKGLAAPWEETILASLEDDGLVGEGGVRGWKEWIAPQLAKAPFEIVSTYDLLWWMNFSLKWQNVELRCLHDGGEPLLARAVDVSNVTGCIRHFFDHGDLECWSCVKDFHEYKFPVLADWKTYKQPLKHFIREFDSNDTYYREKLKVGSLCFGAPSEANSYVNRFHGAIVDLVPSSSQVAGGDLSQSQSKVDPNASPILLTWGACGVALPPDAACMKHLVHPQMHEKIRKHHAPASVFVNPWAESLLETSPFDIMPEFASEDERQHRVFNPVMKNTLTGKCVALLTKDLLGGRTFLDLGACLGASTYWALCMGSSRAVAVEVQESFCKQAEILLGQAQTKGCWNASKNGSTNGGANFGVVCSGAREYLSQCKDGSYDVVLAAGILHCFSDPIHILREIARVAAHAVLLEVTHASVYHDGYLDDPDDPQPDGGQLHREQLRVSLRPLVRRAEGDGMLQLAPQALAIMADSNSSFLGSSVVPSRVAVEASMKSLGFEVTRVYLAKHPSANDELIAYTNPRNFKALSTRYFLRCVRKSTGSIPTRTLESIVVSNDKQSAVAWTESKTWFSFGSSNAENDDESSPADPPKVIDNPDEQWSFDSSVAKRFEREAKCHIPDYADLVGDSILLLEDHLVRISVEKEDVKVVDVGCATGYTLVKLHESGFHNIFGVDTSIHMIDRAREKLHSINRDLGNNLYRSEVPSDLPPDLTKDGERLGAAFVNWTLQFVLESDARRTFLANIAKHMKPGGLLVLTEKTTQNDLTKKGYYDFKRSNGVSEEEIAIKEARLKGVLEPFDVNWYFGALRDSGFDDVCISRAKHGFVTFVAKRADDDPVAPVAPAEAFRVWPNVSSAAKEVQFEAQEEYAGFRMSAWGNSTDWEWKGGSDTATVYGFVYNGTTEISVRVRDANRTFTLFDGMYFACPGVCHVRGGSGVIQVVDNYRAMFAFGGPVEDEGRLPYIDGCTDSLLLAPATRGAPCLNHLHFPSGVVQTQHTHPSGRSGIVLRGSGTCVCDIGKTRVALEPGTAFIIPAHVLHAFETSEDEELDVIAFHPDTDFGPSSNDHPMINRTMVNGVSASKLCSIQTKLKQ